MLGVALRFRKTAALLTLSSVLQSRICPDLTALTSRLINVVQTSKKNTHSKAPRYRMLDIVGLYWTRGLGGFDIDTRGNR